MIRTKLNGDQELCLINIFSSIQGEGYAAGKPTVFIRTMGCNLRCVYCDTKECWTKDNFHKVYSERNDFMWMTAKDIFDKVESIEKNWLHKSICLTGGEPLMEENKDFMINELLPLFVNAHYQVDIETDGGIDYSDYKKTFGDAKVIDGSGNREGITIIADYKLPCSGMTSKMIQSNFDIYSDLDLVKMVISDEEEDWKELERVVNKNTKASFYISPCFGKVALHKIPEFIIKHADKNIRAQIQAHKIFWSPTTKDV